MKKKQPPIRVNDHVITTGAFSLRGTQRHAAEVVVYGGTMGRVVSRNRHLLNVHFFGWTDPIIAERQHFRKIAKTGGTR